MAKINLTPKKIYEQELKQACVDTIKKKLMSFR